AADDDTIAAFVEDLRDAGGGRAVTAPVEAHAHVAAVQRGVVADHPPWRATRLVIQRGQEVPRPRGLVLELRALDGALAELRLIRRRAHELERYPIAHRLG